MDGSAREAVTGGWGGGADSGAGRKRGSDPQASPVLFESLEPRVMLDGVEIFSPAPGTDPPILVDTFVPIIHQPTYMDILRVPIWWPLVGLPIIGPPEIIVDPPGDIVETIDDSDRPALVEVVKGDLIITGGDGDQRVEIDQEGLPAGQVRVSQGDEDTILEGFTGDLLARFGAGDDMLELTGVDIPGKLKIDGGAGDDWFELEDVTVGGGLIVHLGKGWDDLGLTRVDIAGKMVVEGTGGGDADYTMEDVTIGKGMTADMGAGSTCPVMKRVVIGGDFRLKTRAGHYPGEGTYDDYELELYYSRIDGDVVLDGGRGWFYVDIEGTVIGGNVKAASGAALYADGEWEGDYYFWLDQSQVGGSVDLDFGRGCIEVWLSEATVGGSLRVDTGGNHDGYGGGPGGCASFEMEYSEVRGDVRIATGPGGESFDLWDSQVGGSISISTTAATDEGELYGEFSYWLDTMVIGGSVTIRSGAGDSDVEIYGVDVGGSILVTAKPGWDPSEGVWYGWYGAYVEASTVAGDVTVRCGRGDSSFGSEGTRVGGDVAVFSAGGDDDVYVADSDIGGDLVIDNGGGDSCTEVTSATVGGGVWVTDSSARYDDDVWGDYSVEFLDVEIGADLTIRAAGGFSHEITLDEVIANDAVIQTSGVADEIDLDFCELSGSLTIFTPGGDDDITLNGGSAIGGNVTVACGGGADEVEVGLLTVGGNLTIRAGTGDDSVVIEDGADVGRNLLIGGGRGSDSAVVDAASIGRDLKVSGAEGSDRVLLAGGTDVVGRIAVRTGGGADRVELAACSVGGATTLATGGDNDVVHFTEPDDPEGPPAAFAGKVHVATSGGDDSVRGVFSLGYAGAFVAGVLCEGGKGSDILETPQLLAGPDDLFSLAACGFERYSEDLVAPPITGHGPAPLPVA